MGHLRLLHAQLGVDAGHYHVQGGEQLLLLVEGAVFEDVDLDAGEDPERSQLLVESGHVFELAQEAFTVQTVRHREPGTVVGEHQILVPQVARRLGHLPDGAATIGPVRVAVTVAPQLPPQGGGRRRRLGKRLLLQMGQIRRHLAGQRLGDDAGGGVAHSVEVLESTAVGQVPELFGRQRRHCGGGTPEGSHLVARRSTTFQQEGDATEGADGVHGCKVAAT